MYRCQVCATVVPARVRASKVVVATRPKVYEARAAERTEQRGRWVRGRPPQRQQPMDKGGEGSEIVRELTMCPKCAAEFESSKATAAVAD